MCWNRCVMKKSGSIHPGTLPANTSTKLAEFSAVRRDKLGTHLAFAVLSKQKGGPGPRQPQPAAGFIDQESANYKQSTMT